MEWSRYGTREISHEEEKRRTLPIRDEKWPKSHDKKKAAAWRNRMIKIWHKREHTWRREELFL
jgi:hypothetical protein